MQRCKFLPEDRQSYLRWFMASLHGSASPIANGKPGLSLVSDSCSIQGTECQTYLVTQAQAHINYLHFLKLHSWASKDSARIYGRPTVDC